MLTTMCDFNLHFLFLLSSFTLFNEIIPLLVFNLFAKFHGKLYAQTFHIVHIAQNIFANLMQEYAIGHKLVLSEY